MGWWIARQAFTVQGRAETKIGFKPHSLQHAATLPDRFGRRELPLFPLRIGVVPAGITASTHLEPRTRMMRAPVLEKPNGVSVVPDLQEKENPQRWLRRRDPECRSAGSHRSNQSHHGHNARVSNGANTVPCPVKLIETASAAKLPSSARNTRPLMCRILTTASYGKPTSLPNDLPDLPGRLRTGLPTGGLLTISTPAEHRHHRSDA